MSLREKLKWLDPFTYVDWYEMEIINPSKNKWVGEAVYLVFAFIFAFILYNFVFAFILGTSTPLVIVYSGSMEPVLYRGDVVVLNALGAYSLKEVQLNFPIKDKLLLEYAQIGYIQLPNGQIRAGGVSISGKEYLFDPNGPIVVYNSSLRGQDIIHRAVLLLNAPDGKYLITFGDNNSRIDQDCKLFEAGRDCISLYPLKVEDVKGKYLIHIPLIGYVKLLVFDDLPRLFAR